MERRIIVIVGKGGVRGGIETDRSWLRRRKKKGTVGRNEGEMEGQRKVEKKGNKGRDKVGTVILALNSLIKESSGKNSHREQYLNSQIFSFLPPKV
jgi:hypothetical protein